MAHAEAMQFPFTRHASVMQSYRTAELHVRAPFDNLKAEPFGDVDGGGQPVKDTADLNVYRCGIGSPWYVLCAPCLWPQLALVAWPR
jgi:hypothetical protein